MRNELCDEDRFIKGFETEDDFYYNGYLFYKKYLDFGLFLMTCLDVNLSFEFIMSLTSLSIQFLHFR